MSQILAALQCMSCKVLDKPGGVVFSNACVVGFSPEFCNLSGFVQDIFNELNSGELSSCNSALLHCSGSDEFSKGFVLRLSQDFVVDWLV